MAGLDIKIKNKMKTKSQVTMLIIFGLALFIVISLVLYLSKSAVKKQSQQGIRKVQESTLEAQPVKEYVVKCLDKLAKDAAIILGKQGGYIYASQGGLLVDYQETDEGLFFVNYNGLKVSYNIAPPKFAVPPYASDVPEYPWKTFPYKTATSNSQIFEGFFGISNIPPLNSSEGPNSLQAQIESFIDANLHSCIDTSIFKSQGFEMAIGQPDTIILIGSSNIVASTKMQVTVSNPLTNERMELNDFAAILDVKMRDIYFFAKNLIENDIKNIRFNLSSSQNEKEPFRIRIEKNVFSNDDVITITDEQSLLNGKPYEYVFARRNRAPALYYARHTELQFPHNFEIKQSDLLKNYELKGEDPDEDSLSFSIIPSLPKILNIPQVKFRIEVSDGQFSDYQIITVNRK